MGLTKDRRLMRWTERYYLQLVEAVIKVEQEMISVWKKNRKHSAGKRTGKWNLTRNSIEKWNAIADLLPRELGEKSWNRDRQMYNKPKCCSMFHNLLKEYRDKVGGKVTATSTWKLSNRVCQILKRREDLINGRFSVPDKSFLRSITAKHVDASESLHHDANHHKPASPTGNSPLNRDTFSLNMGPRSKKTQWTEAARLQVIGAVIRVEQEMKNEIHRDGGISTGHGKRKWDRIADLVPSRLRARMWNSRNQAPGEHKCSRLFYSLIRAYKDKVAGRNGNRGCRALTENVFKLLQTREEVLNAGLILAEEKCSFVCGRSKSVGASENSHQLLRNQTDMTASKKTSTYIGSETEKGGSSFDSHNTDGWESLKGSANVPQCDGYVGTADTDCASHEKSMHLRQTSRSSPVFRSRLLSECNKAEPNGSWAGAETRAQTRAEKRDYNSATSRAAGQLRPSTAKRKRTTSMSQSTSDQRMHTILDRLLKRIEIEFSHLSSWVHSRAIRDEFKSSIISSAKKWQVHAKRSRVGAVTSSSNKMIDDQVRVLFYKLRVQFAVELTNVREEIAQEVKEGAYVLNNSHRSSQK